jgi:hypothetical protein
VLKEFVDGFACGLVTVGKYLRQRFDERARFLTAATPQLEVEKVEASVQEPPIVRKLTFEVVAHSTPAASEQKFIM